MPTSATGLPDRDSADREYVVAGGHRWALRRWPGPETPRAQAPTIVALHGFTGTGDDFAPLVRGPSAIPGRWLSVDILGHGHSDAPPYSSKAYAMPAVAAALADVLAVAVQGSPYVLVGYSMGARLALSLVLGEFATQCRWPRPAGLVLIGGTPGIADPLGRAQRQVEDVELAESLLSRGLDWFIDTWANRPILASKKRIAAPLRSAMAARFRLQRVQGLAGSLRGMGTGAMPSLWGALEHLHLPTLWVTGADDPKFTEIAREVVATVPGAERVILGEVGHSAHLEAVAGFSAAFQRWQRCVFDSSAG